MKRIVCFLVIALLLMSMLGGCTKEDNGEEKVVTNPQQSDVKLTFMANIQGVQFEVLEEICADFTAETGIEVEAISHGSSYEELMKTKMASKDLPDLFTTHGWSVARYSEYLRTLNDQPWANNISSSIKPLITNENDEIFVLPMDVDLSGIVYNKTVVEEAGVNIDDIKTWDDFQAACEKIKTAGYNPIHIAGKDSWTIGQFFDWVAPAFYITDDNNNHREAFKNGTYDWNLWGDLLAFLDELNTKGYINTDSLTAEYMTGINSLAEGKTAFEFYGNYAINEALKVNPDAKLGMMPIPSLSADDEPTLIGGERTAIGVWEDSTHMDEALQLLNFMAKPENVSKVASSNSLPAGLKGVDSDKGVVSEDYIKYADVETFPYFDREYLPSGMWDDLCATGAEVLAKGNSAIPDQIKYMEQSFKDKFKK